MSDPYSILGLTKTASDEEIKKNYRQLSRKYHPDNNMGNPYKEQSNRMFRMIQTAYEQIMDEREHPYPHADSFRSGRPEPNIANMQNAARLLKARSYHDALHILMMISTQDARWFVYMALAYNGLGKMNLALHYARNASQMDPANKKYERLVMELEQICGKRKHPPGSRSDDLYKKAVSNIFNGKYSDALRLLETIEKHDAEWNYLMALVNQGLGKMWDALQYAMTACQMDPNNDDYRNLAHSLEDDETCQQAQPFRDSQYSEIRQSIEKEDYSKARAVLKNMPGYHEARWYYYSALAANGMKDNITALQYAKTASEMEPDNTSYAKLVDILQTGSWYTSRQVLYKIEKPEVENSGFPIAFIIFALCFPFNWPFLCIFGIMQSNERDGGCCE